MLGFIADYPGSVAFYVLITIVCWVLARQSEESCRPIALGVAVLLLVVVSALRSPLVGIDTKGYVSAYSHVTPSYFELGFTAFIDLLRPLQAPELYLGIIAFVIYGLIFLRLWELKDTCSLSGAVIFFMLVHFAATWNGLRSCIVMAIMFYASRYIQKGQFLRFFIAVVLCCTIHSTSLVFLLLLVTAPLWANNYSRAKKTLVTLGALISPLVVVAALMWMRSNAAFARYDVAYAAASTADHLGLSWYLYFAIFMIAIFYCLKSDDGLNSETKFSMACVGLGIVLFLIGFTWYPGGRLSSYFLIYDILFLPRAWSLSKGRRHGVCFRFMVCLYCCYAFYQVLASNGQGILPYLIG